MNLEKGNGLWLVNWFPMLFDILTVLLLVAGCLLLWLNLMPRFGDVLLTRKGTSDPGMLDDASRLFSPGVFTTQEPAKLSADAPSPEESITADAANTVDQNSYVGRVASAMMKLRSQR